MAELVDLVRSRPESYVRYSAGPEHDASEQSRDTESGLDLPGLSVNPLHPEAWWTRPLEDWLARQVCQYAELAEKNRDRFAWVLDGRMVGRGPDCEPLLADIQPLAILTPRLLDEATARYERNFDAHRGPED
ncbi:hypothetical protein GCM10010921_14670 [Microbacterium album]|uniref:Uncharacterized protein n=2 Tax=Microbacterium album TaxID=2053191 RepID=A0A917MLM4_9MICO|nr:hypothetical protein GCM10010921_14670 [Microbacterium album]